METKRQEVMINWALSLSADELLLIHNALNEIINGSNAISSWEFQTRVGVEFQQAAELLHKTGVTLNDVCKESR